MTEAEVNKKSMSFHISSVTKIHMTNTVFLKLFSTLDIPIFTIKAFFITSAMNASSILDYLPL